MVERMARGWRSYEPFLRWFFALAGVVTVGLIASALVSGRSLRWTAFIIPVAVWLIWLPWSIWRRGRRN